MASAERIKFLPGEFFVYVNGSSWELGKVKREADEEGTAYFCWYSSGTTVARTPVECMHKLANAYGGPAEQWTVERFVQSCCTTDTSLEIEDYFRQSIIWAGLVRDLPGHLSLYPVEDSGVCSDGTWCRICP